MDDLPASLALASRFRSWGGRLELETIAHAAAAGRRARGGGSCCWAASPARARAGWRANSPPRRPGGSAGPLRRLRRRGPHAVRAVRRGFDRLVRRDRPDELRGSWAPAAASSPVCSLICPRGSASCRRRSRRIPTPSATDCTRPSPICWPRRPGRPLLLVIEDGHWADAPTLLLLRHWPRARPGACCCSPPSATPRRTCPSAGPDAGRPAPRRRRRPPAGRGSAGGGGRRIRPAGRGRLAPAPTCGSSRGDQRTHRRQRVPRVRAVAGAGRDGVVEVDGALRLTRPLADLGTPESVREVVSQRLARLTAETRPARARRNGGRGVRARARPSRARARRARARGGARRGGAQRVHRGAPGRPRLAYRFTHELVRRAVYDRLSARAPGRAPPSRGRGA